MAAKVLTGHLKLGTSALTAVDVSDEVTAFKVMGERETVEVPPTLANPRENRAGSRNHSIEIGYLSDDAAATVFSILWEGLQSASGELYFEGAGTDDVISEDNPLWSGTFIVTSAEFGGDAEALSRASGTFPLKTTPTKAIVEES